MTSAMTPVGAVEFVLGGCAVLLCWRGMLGLLTHARLQARAAREQAKNDAVQAKVNGELKDRFEVRVGCVW